MSDFNKWWKKLGKEIEITEMPAQAAWNHQQKRIENLREAVEIISDYEPKDEHDGWIKDVCGIALKRDKELENE